MEWQSLDPATQCLCYALGHQYTSAALRLASLKGYDYCQARFVADVCNQVDSFHVLLARMEKTLSNYENGDETFEILLKQIVDLEGFLLQDQLTIPDTFILQSSSTGQEIRMSIPAGNTWVISMPKLKRFTRTR